MPDIITQIDRLKTLSELLVEMCKEYNMEKFYELNRRFKERVAVDRLEDEINV